MEQTSLSESPEPLFLVIELDTSPGLMLVVLPARARDDETVAYWRRTDSFLAGMFLVEVGRA